YGAEHEGIAVRVRVLGDLHADDAVAARTIVHDGLLAPSFGQLLSDRARGNVGAAPGNDQDDDADRAVRIRVGRLTEKTREAQQKCEKHAHGWKISVENLCPCSILYLHPLSHPSGTSMTTVAANKPTTRLNELTATEMVAAIASGST